MNQPVDYPRIGANLRQYIRVHSCRFADKVCRALLIAAALIVAACAPSTPTPTATSTTATLARNPTPLPSPTQTVTVAPSRTATPSPTAAPIATATARPTLPRTTVDAETGTRHRRIFEQVWNTVHTQYVYPDFNGADWDAIHAEYGARIERGLRDEDFWLAMAEMIDRLGDDHSSFLSPSEAREQDSQLQGNLTYAGIGIYAAAQAEKKQAVIFIVFPGGPADAAGLRSHDTILAINGQPVINDDGSDNLERLRGRPGTRVAITVRSPGQPPREVSLPRAQIDGTLSVTGYTRLIEPGARRIGYMLIPTLWDAHIAATARETLIDLTSAGPLDGLILDLRINGGGTSTNLLALLAFFTAGTRGEFVSRDESRLLEATPEPIGNSQSVPLVILISEDTESYAEVFSGVLLEAGRAQLVGRLSAGNIETVYSYDFEDGSRAWIARETFIPPSGDRWENVGLAPGVRVDQTWDEFTNADDPGIAAAIDLLTQSTD